MLNKNDLAGLNHAKITGRQDTFDYKEVQWHSSTARTDTDQGACEVIYVKDIEVLMRGNAAAQALNTLAFYGLILLVFLNLMQMSRPDANQET